LLFQKEITDDFLPSLAGYHSSIDNSYGYTLVWYRSYMNLLFLRARWYAPETGTFLSKDPVESEPPYLYVRGNPINGTDPSGLCENQDQHCWELYRQLITQFPGLPGELKKMYNIDLHRLSPDLLQSLLIRPSAEIIARTSPSNVLGLIRLFEADHFPGKDARGRIRWILDKTASMHPRSYLQFSLFPADDSGFCNELADGAFYADKDIWVHL
jgi:RHS repeat-associated protein